MFLFLLYSHRTIWILCFLKLVIWSLTNWMHLWLCRFLISLFKSFMPWENLKQTYRFFSKVFFWNTSELSLFKFHLIIQSSYFSVVFIKVFYSIFCLNHITSLYALHFGIFEIYYNSKDLFPRGGVDSTYDFGTLVTEVTSWELWF